VDIEVGESSTTVRPGTSPSWTVGAGGADPLCHLAAKQRSIVDGRTHPTVAWEHNDDDDDDDDNDDDDRYGRGPAPTESRAFRSTP
jgi:hypothetical protein